MKTKNFPGRKALRQLRAKDRQERGKRPKEGPTFWPGARSDTRADAAVSDMCLRVGREGRYADGTMCNRMPFATQRNPLKAPVIIDRRAR